MDNNIQIYIRPLREEDAQVSYRWRNNPDIWKYTGSKPDKTITEEIELSWIKEVLKRNNEKRYAICLIDTDEYIGNVQLTNIENNTAEFHIFIGEKKYWGKDIGFVAAKLMIDKGIAEFGLSEIYLSVSEDNAGAVKIYEKCGFTPVEKVGNIIKMNYKKKKPLVSVFMIAYNHGKYISEALESILMQKVNFDYEIVVGEDASKDNTREIILKYVKKDPQKFKLLFHEKNIGANANQNTVLRACEGKYIAMLEGDDYWTDPEKLQKQIDFLEGNSSYAACFHDVTVEAIDKEINEQIVYINNQVDFSIDDFIQQGNRLHTCSVVFRKQKVGFPEYLKPVTGDYFLHIYNSSYGKFYRIKEYMACYRLHAGGTFSQRDQWSIEKQIDFFKRQTQTFLYVKDELNYSSKSKEKLDLIIKSHINNLRIYLLLNKEYSEAKKVAKYTYSHVKMNFKEKTFVFLTRVFPAVYSSYLRNRFDL